MKRRNTGEAAGKGGGRVHDRHSDGDGEGEGMVGGAPLVMVSL